MFQIKHQNLKKILFINILLFLTLPVQAQMMDLMGTVGIGGLKNINDAEAVDKMDQSLHSVQFLDELQIKNIDISTTYFGNYSKMPTQFVFIDDIKVTFKPIDNGRHFEAYIPSVSKPLCLSLIDNKIDNLVEYRLVINGKSKAYKFSQIKEKKDICKAVSAMKLIFK